MKAAKSVLEGTSLLFMLAGATWWLVEFFSKGKTSNTMTFTLFIIGTVFLFFVPDRRRR